MPIGDWVAPLRGDASRHVHGNGRARSRDACGLHPKRRCSAGRPVQDRKVGKREPGNFSQNRRYAHPSRLRFQGSRPSPARYRDGHQDDIEIAQRRRRILAVVAHLPHAFLELRPKGSRCINSRRQRTKSVLGHTRALPRYPRPDGKRPLFPAIFSRPVRADRAQQRRRTEREFVTAR
jgi:hypothetical protein